MRHKVSKIYDKATNYSQRAIVPESSSSILPTSKHSEHKRNSPISSKLPYLTELNRIYHNITYNKIA